MAKETKIPQISEWYDLLKVTVSFRFEQLSVEDRVLALSAVDLEIVRSIKRML